MLNYPFLLFLSKRTSSFFLKHPTQFFFVWLQMTSELDSPCSEQDDETFVPRQPSSSAALVPFTPSTWMACLRSNICHRSLNELFLLGTHNSATCHIDPQFIAQCPDNVRKSLVAPDAPSGLQKLPAMVEAKAFKTVAGWARTQEVGVGQQLREGVRFLDLRIAPRDVGCAGVQLWVVHALFSQRLLDVFCEVVDFLQNPLSPPSRGADQHGNDTDHPCSDELVMIDLQRLIGWTALRDDALLVSDVENSGLRKYLFEAPFDCRTPLHVLWESSPRKRVLLSAPRTSVQPSWLYRTGEDVVAPWADQCEAKKLQPALLQQLDQFVCSYATSTKPRPVYVVQAILTPRTWNVVKGIMAPAKAHRSVLDLSKHVNSRMLELFVQMATKRKFEQPRVGLVLLLDYFHLFEDTVRVCIELNVT